MRNNFIRKIKPFFAFVGAIGIAGSVFIGIAYAAPTQIFQKSIFPEVTDRYDLGSSTPAFEWNGLYVKTICLSGVCNSAWPAGGSGVWPFTTSSNNFGSTPQQSTTTPEWFKGNGIWGLFASSTSVFDFASTTGLSTSNFWITGQATGCAQFGADAKLTSTGVNCGSGGGGTWGSITGTLSAQADLDAALKSKLGTSSALTANQVIYATSFNTTASVATGTVSCLGVLGCTSFTVLGGSASIALSGTKTANQMLYFDSGASNIRSVATSSPIFSYPFTTSGTAGYLVDGSGFTIAFSGVATSAAPTIGNLAYWTSDRLLGTVATGTVSAGSSAITVTAGRAAIGGALAIDCATAGSGQNGCLSSGDWTTFNSKQATLSFNTPLILGGTSVSYSGMTTSTALTGGQLLYATNASTVTSVATGTVSAGSTALTVTANRFAIGGALAIDCATATGSQTGCLSGTDWSTFNGKQASLGYVPWGGTLSTTFATTTIASTTPLWAKTGIFASSTSQFDFASSTGGITTANFWDTGLTSVLALFDANHKETAYGGASSCGANNFFTGLSAAGVSSCGNSTIGATSPNSSLSFGSAAAFGSTFTGDINLANPNSWTGKQTFGAASSTNLSASNYFSIPSSATQAPTIAGQIALDTTNDQLVIGDGSAASVFDKRIRLTLSYATTTAWAGTTTLPVFVIPQAVTWNTIQCVTDAGTLNTQYQYGTAPTKPAMLSASTTVGSFSWSASNTPTAGATSTIAWGTPASSPTQVSCTLTGTVTGT